MDINEKWENGQSMRVVLPILYNHFMMELEKQHIHSYDIQANAVEKETGYQIIIKFGEGFSQTKSTFLTHKSIKDLDTSITNYIKSIAEDCKQVMIAEYFKMMKM